MKNPIQSLKHLPQRLGEGKKGWSLVLFFGRKAVGFILMAILLGYLMDFAARRNDPEHPAGFWWGMAHGAMMPATLPALILGKDTTIYAPHNQGRIYKIGYTMGVNVCGAIFFGLVFWSPRRSAGPTVPGPDQ